LNLHCSIQNPSFKIPVRSVRSDTDTCAVGGQSRQAAVFRETRLIVWDEISMTNRKDLEAVDRSLRDIRQRDAPFGGVLVVCAGDFRQLLPVVVRGTRANSVLACVSRSRLWLKVRKHRLTRNLRLMEGRELSSQYAQFLLQVCKRINNVVYVYFSVNNNNNK
jgi:hypothetical protein